MAIKNPEKRFDARLDHRTQVTLENFEGGVMHEARMINYSRKGLYFESDFYLIPGAEIYIGIPNSPFISEPGVYECYRSVIKWRKFLDHSAYDYGYGIEIQTCNPQCRTTKNRAESRLHARKSCSIPTLIQDKTRRIRGVIQNASSTGVFIQCSEKPQKGQKVSLTIPLKKKRKLISRSGEIVWSDENGIGIRFQSDPSSPHFPA
jgi:hypothetical protein